MKKNSIFKRLIGLVLSLVLVASCLPAGLLPTASAAGESTGILSADSKVDPNTLNAWKDTSFNPYNLTTEHAGGVWTDKTVVKAGDASTVFADKNGQPLGITAGDNNFLVALSALGANSVVAGQGTTPTDTIFVLDVSNSMENTDLTAMVAATNDAIHSLLTANSDNRVGVVVYSTNVSVLLELDRYTPVEKGYFNKTIAYIEMSDNYGQIRTARTGGYGSTTYVKDSSGNNETTSISASGATYIQGGLWQALEEFNDATVTDKRTPVLVLMSDGAPSYGTEDYNDVSTTSRDVGNGGTNSITDGLAFLTQLTAAYVKEKIADKYNTTPYFYSVGLGVSESGQNVSIAEAVLDTSKTRQDPESWWSTYLGLADKTTKTMRISASGENVTVTYDPTITSTSKTYVNRYFPADDASQLSTAFQGIVDEINLKSSYNVTRIEGNDAHFGGYVTFVDEIGTGMEVKDIKGILVGDTLYTGKRLAEALFNSQFGTAENPTILGDNMVWALKQRLGITDLVMDTATGPVTITATERVHDLIRQAYDAGQIAYNAQTGEFSNLFCWFSDANGDYLSFWDAADPDCEIPAGAAYANASYGMLGTTTDSQTAHASDMMYVAVMVSKQITQVNGAPALEAKTPELVTFRVPASLLPTVTYQIDVQASADEEITEQTPATITYNEAEPIRLVYEVGVHSQLTPENIKDFLRPGYQAKDAAGNYYLYTNAWYWEPSDGSAADFRNPPTKDNAIGKDVLYDTSKNHISYAYFEPSEQNEHYYYTEDTTLYTYNGTSYEKLTTAPVTDGSVKYYFQHKTYVSENAATEIGVAVDAQVNIHYGEVSQKLLSDSNNYAQDATTGVYYIKEGTMHYHTIHEHDKLKKENPTGSFAYRLHQLVDIAVDRGEDSHHYEIAYLGNNGRVTYSPAQGFTLSKVMADNATATGSFTFDVTLGDDDDGKYTETRNGVSTEKPLTNNAFTVSLAAGEQVTITGIDVGATYTVTEQERDGYKLGGIVVSDGSVSGATATGTVVENQIHSVTYTNDIQKYGTLTVTKQVNYLDNVNPTDDDNEFPVTVTLKDGAENFTGNVLLNAANYPVTDGKVKFNIRHGGNVTIAGIPEGVTYTVVEDKTNLPYGYTWANEGVAALSGTIDADGQTVQLSNAYDPESLTLNDEAAIEITKLYQHIADDTATYKFDFELQRLIGSTWTKIKDSSVEFVSPTRGEHTKKTTLDLSGEVFTAAGEYFFRIAEVVPPAQEPGMTYDRTHHDFKVVVTDEDLDGNLELKRIEAVDATVTAEKNAQSSIWEISAKFTNHYETNSTKLTIGANKTLTGAILKDGQFEFALYKVSDGTFDITGITPIIAKNGANGDIVFTTETYPFASGTTAYYYVMKEQKLDDAGNPIQPNADGEYVYKGVTMDKKVWEIQVEVQGNTSGNAQINGIKYREKGQTSWITGAPVDNVFNAITFENTYTPESVKQEIVATKTLTDMTPGANNAAMTVLENKFSFTLSAVTTGAPIPADATVFAARGGAVSFGEIEFTNAGTYVYKLVENDTNISGVTYDKSEYTVTVVVTDKGTGKLEADVVYSKNGDNSTAATFENTYKAAPIGDLKINAKKKLTVDTGFERPLKANDFRVTLTNRSNGSTETVYNDADGFFNFAPLSIDTVGEYEYSISEVIPQGATVITEGSTVKYVKNGVTYDAVAKDFKIKVTDSGAGQLVAKIGDVILSSTATTAAIIENSYAADQTSIHLTAHKDLVGRDLKANEFSFKIEAVTASAPMPATVLVKNGDNGMVDFGTITYTAIGTYQYEVTEQKLDENGDPIAADPITGNYIYKGVTYSDKKYIVTVRVDDLQNGKLIAHVSSVDQNNNAQPGGVVFTNTYKAAPVDAEIEATKELYDLTGGARDPLAVPENTYKFKLEALNGAPASANGEVFAAAGGAISFGKIQFTKAGTYQYTLTEIDTNVPGVTADPSVYTVEVKIKDDLVGSLEVESIAYIKSNTSYGSAVFTNNYAATGTSAEITATKKLTNVTPGIAEADKVMAVPGNTYKFKLEAITTGAPMPREAEVFAAAGGAVEFAAITYTKAGVYEYKLTEIDMDVAGVTNDDAVYTVKVTVKDGGAGALYVDSITYNGETAAVFENEYLAKPIEIHVEGDSTATDGKIFTDESSLPENKKDLDDYEFRFTLAQLDGTVIETVSDNGKGFAFEKLKFDTAGEYQYLIYEMPGNDAGVTYDYAKYRVTVTVTDEGSGQLKAAVKYEKASSGESDDYQTVSGVVFENTYKAKETAVSFAGVKTLTGGKKLQANDFSFILKNASGEELETVKNDGNGIFAFKKITYYTEGIFVYTLEEIKGNAEGITYDAAKYTLTVTVKDVDGELKATTTITKDGKAADSYGFTNIFTPKAVGTSVEVQKVLVNKSEETVGLNGFVFQLECDGQKQTLTTGADGKVKFDLSFDATDIGKTYTYKLSEVKGDKAHMTYDAAVYEVKVTVSQAPNTGELELAVSRTGTGAFQFTNTYEPPVADEDDPPKTGDESHIGRWTLMMAVSAVGVLTVLVLGKKKRFEQ